MTDLVEPHPRSQSLELIIQDHYKLTGVEGDVNGRNTDEELGDMTEIQGIVVTRQVDISKRSRGNSEESFGVAAGATSMNHDHLKY